MNATAVVTFPNSDQAFGALKALEASSGSMVCGSIVATKDLNGNLFLNETAKDKVGGTIAGAFIFGLAGLPLGAAAVTFGAIAGALIGATADFLSRGGRRKARQGNRARAGARNGLTGDRLHSEQQGCFRSSDEISRRHCRAQPVNAEGWLLLNFGTDSRTGY